MKEFKISIAAARVNANLTQAQAAEKIGVTPRTVCSWENGLTSPKVKQLDEIAEVYEIPKDILDI